MAPISPALPSPSPAPVAAASTLSGGPAAADDAAAPAPFAKVLDQASRPRPAAAKATTPASAGKPAAAANKPAAGDADAADAGPTSTSATAGDPVVCGTTADGSSVPAPTSGSAGPSAANTDLAAVLAGLVAAARLAEQPRPTGGSTAASAGAPATGAAGARSAASAAGVVAEATVSADATGTPGWRSVLAAAEAAEAAGAAGAGAVDAPRLHDDGPGTNASSALLPAPLALASMATASAASKTATAKLAASPGSAEFAPQLGAQISTFVRDGIHHALLELNPAEMGPVTVQIQLDGQNAQVHLAAQNGQTREALEQAMPMLAGSLREAGLTLGGGGVSDQPRQSEQPQPDAASSRRGTAAGPTAIEAPTPAAGAVARRGVVDLVA